MSSPQFTIINTTASATIVIDGREYPVTAFTRTSTAERCVGPKWEVTVERTTQWIVRHNFCNEGAWMETCETDLTLALESMAEFIIEEIAIRNRYLARMERQRIASALARRTTA